MARAGVSEDEIAARLNVGLDIVKAGVGAMEAYRQSYSHDIVDMKINEVVINQLDNMQQAFSDGLAAMRLLEETGPNGEPIFQIDHNTRIKMIDAISNLIDKVRPKTGAGVAVNILNQNNNQNVAGGAGRSFEARVRTLRDRRGIKDQSDNIIEANPGEDDNDPLEDGSEGNTDYSDAEVLNGDGEEDDEVELVRIAG